VLRYHLVHPELLAALAGAGHGSTILIADGNYAHSTGTSPSAPVIHLNLRPGLLTVDHVLAALVEASPFERATVMAPDDGSPSPVLERYQQSLGLDVPVDVVDREHFRNACRSPDLAATVATADERHYANILLTVGALAKPGASRGPHRTGI
jgi:L-fucose mutarotase